MMQKSEHEEAESGSGAVSAGQAGRERSVLMSALSAVGLGGDLGSEPPIDPMPTLVKWFEEARSSGRYDDFNAMTLATCGVDGAPSARVVLCKAIEEEPPAIVFYTNYKSRKGRELGENPRAAAVFHWPHAKRQARVEGVVERTSAEESDAYFRTRPLISRIGALASPQSQPISGRDVLVASALRVAGGLAFGQELTRPEHWGGFRVRVRRVELWSAREGRMHDRVSWECAESGSGQREWRLSRIAP